MNQNKGQALIVLPNAEEMKSGTYSETLVHQTQETEQSSLLGSETKTVKDVGSQTHIPPIKEIN